MEFWRIYRLVYARRWLIAAIVLITAALILIVSTFQASRAEYTSEALLGSQDAPPPPPTEGGQSAPRSEEGSARISGLVLLLRGSNDLVADAVALLRLPEHKRVQEVRRILERNGSFASTDADIESRVDEMIASGELKPAARQQEIDKLRASARESAVHAIALARDRHGPFAADGVQDSPEAIADALRRKMHEEAIDDLLSTENSRRLSNQIRITGQFSREAEANLYVNLFCVAFLDFYRKQSASVTNTRIAGLRARLQVADRELRHLRVAEARYRAGSENQMLAAGPESFTPLQAQEDLVRRYEQESRGAAAAVAILEQGLRRTNERRTVQMPADENPQVRAIEMEVSKAWTEYLRLKNASNLGENFSRVGIDPAKNAYEQWKTLAQERERLRKQPYTLSTIDPGRMNLEQRYADAMQRQSEASAHLAIARTQLAALKQRQQRLPIAQGTLQDLRNRLSIKQNTFNSVLRELEQEQLNAVKSNRAGTVTIVSQAVVKPSPDSAGRRVRLLVYGVILSLLLGISLVIAIDALDNSLRTTVDVETLFGLPIAGVVPAQLPDPNRAPRITALAPHSAEAEAYRLLRSNILFSLAEETPFQSLLITAVKPGHGATTTACNLAIALAQAGKRVILVDANLRRPQLHEVFEIPSERGLTSLLQGQCALEDALRPARETGNLLVLPAGPNVLTPSEMLGGMTMQALLTQLKPLADFVLLDSPSAVAFADSSHLAALADRTLLVVKANNVPRSAEQQVRALLSKAGARILGIVLNAVTPDRVDSVFYHKHYYPALRGKEERSAALPPADPPPSMPPGTFGTAPNEPVDLRGPEIERPLRAETPAHRQETPFDRDPPSRKDEEASLLEDEDDRDAGSAARPAEPLRRRNWRHRWLDYNN